METPPIRRFSVNVSASISYYLQVTNLDPKSNSICIWTHWLQHKIRAEVHIWDILAITCNIPYPVPYFMTSIHRLCLCLESQSMPLLISAMTVHRYYTYVQHTCEWHVHIQHTQYTELWNFHHLSLPLPTIAVGGMFSSIIRYCYVCGEMRSCQTFCLLSP